jgi:5-formyltetrahydrofolate cyclo-ligase
MLSAAQFPDLRAMRKQLRQLRNELSAEQHKLHSQAICKHAEQLLASREDSHIGAYNAFDGEPELSSLLSRPQAQYWFPVVEPQSNKMTFARGSKLQQNQYGITEPKAGSEISADQLSLIFVPLVGYDKHCNRIGMGKGFYDRALQSLGDETLLVGISHSCQQVDSLIPQPWDVALDCVITETGIIYPPK